MTVSVATDNVEQLLRMVHGFTTHSALRDHTEAALKTDHTDPRDSTLLCHEDFEMNLSLPLGAEEPREL